MTRYWLNVLLFRVVYPLVLTKSIIWRPCGLSALYLILALLSPLIPVPTADSMKGITGYFLIFSVFLTFMASFTQLTFHLVLFALPPYGHFLNFCELPEKILRHIGLVRLDGTDSGLIFFYWLTPEVTVFPLILCIYFIIRRITQIVPKDDVDDMYVQQHEAMIKERNAKIINFLGRIGTYIVLITLCCIASLVPSIQGGLYFFVFIIAATYWAFNRDLRRGFGFVCRYLMPIVAVHIFAFLAYQTQWPQELLPANSTWARYFGMETEYLTNCTDPREVLVSVDSVISMYPYMALLFFLYYMLALQSKFLFQKPRPYSALQPAETSERTPLMRFGPGRTGLLQDSTGSVTVQDGQPEDTIQMQSLNDNAAEEKPGIVEHVIMVVFSVYQLLINSCYLAANIIMMTWSIMYHSWTTFILLLWALVLWMVPNKRQSMLKWSPFIVFYSTILLLVQYLYCMNFNESELPTVIYGIKMADLGFVKPDQLSTTHMLVKCSFITMFWITMRQYMVEKARARRSSTMRDMVAPLHVSVTAATAAMQTEAERELKNKLMKSIGGMLKTLFTKFWIVVVAVMLFTSGITGDRMTVFRIVYMSLFLLFIITFQICWELWRKMMYTFWIAVIGYSVIMLILVYTYQFSAFPGYWDKYLHISENLQKDIGLIKYDTKDLFVRLLTPTFFVIISVLQIHYFHKDFLEVSDLKKSSPVPRQGGVGSVGAVGDEAQVISTSDVYISESSDESPLWNFKGFKHMSKLEKLELLRYLRTYMYDTYNNTWLFLELHMQKIVFISFVLLCINDVCAINFLFMVTVAASINLSRFMQIVAIKLMTVAVAILMVTKMLYQIDYIEHGNWDRNCTDIKTNATDNSTIVFNKTYNMAEWIGLRKVDAHTDLSQLLSGYIWIIGLTTLRSVILVRQWFHRAKNKESLDTPLLMFSYITRGDADKGIVPCFKFLLNFGFYKFGLELCLIFMVLLIGTRLDIYSVVYSLWLIALFGLKRQNIARIWPMLKIFAIVLLPLQYAIVVAPPPWLCIDYPWAHAEPLKSLQEWMFLPNPDSRPNPHKLLYDYIVLMLIVRQSLVFNVEYRSTLTGREFIAGHNYSVHRLMDNPNFVNPVKDYVSNIHNYLDVLKRGTMMSLLWITLSIMFLAGTKRTNLFSLGYLIGAFVFLWQGNDFYLRPVRIILKWWNILIAYNVFVILFKSLFQGVGCIFIDQLAKNRCWVVQLLGIACLKKFNNASEQFLVHPSCEMDREDIGMFWDGLCFAFLIFQKRLFRSYYFFHIVDETKAMSILASRGAELLEELHQKRIVEQENHEKTILQKIKAKMEKIKATQKRIATVPKSEHRFEKLYGTYSRPVYQRYKPKTYKEAIRSGDYYMFDDIEDDDDLTDLTVEVVEEQQRERDSPMDREFQPREMTVGELMNTLITTDIEIATHVALYGGTKKDALKLRRRSVPLTRKKSAKSHKSTRSESAIPAATDRDPGGSPSPDGTEDELDEDLDSKAESEHKISVITYFKFIWAFLNSIMVSLTKYLNNFSNDYRYIRKVLAKEKKMLKATTDFRKGTRLGLNQIWQPLAIAKYKSFEEVEESEVKAEDAGEGPSVQDDMPRSSELYRDEEEEEAVLSEMDQPPIIQLAAAIWFGILAHSTFLCYFMVFLYQIRNASILSTPLPLMVFMWGSLTIPRPSKTFWITMVAYIEVIVIIKCICQPAFLSWNQKEMSPTYPFEIPRILGVERKRNYAMWDLLLLLVVFFHRFMLKSLGQWTTPQVKGRKNIPTKPALALLRNQEEGQGDNTGDNMTVQSSALGKSEIIVKTPEGRVLSIQPFENPEIQDHLARGDYERLVVISGSERSLIEEDFGKAMNLTLRKYFEPVSNFFREILDPTGKERTNVYAYMFLCDFFNFILLIFGFSSFGATSGDGGVTAYFEENHVPMPFLLMLLLQFALIVIDRALFLKKSIFGKLIFQYCLIVGVHLWMFLALPSATERQFNARSVPQIWYMVKCFYLLLAAYQLRQGYPTRILGNFLCKKFSMVNYVLFKGFMTIPFLFEMRAVMDWIWTDTSMAVMDWFKMEDIFATVYQIKCMRGLESDYPQPRGTKKAQLSKNLVGGGALLLMIGMIWFPLLLFAVGSTVGTSNPPHEVTLTLQIGSYEPIYTIAAQNSSIFQYSDENYQQLRELYEVTHRDRAAVTFLENYASTDIVAVKLSTESSKLWGISPPDKRRLMAELKSKHNVVIHVEWSIARKPASKELSGVTNNVYDIPLPAMVNGKFNPTRRDLLIALGEDPSVIESLNLTAFKHMEDNPNNTKSVLLHNVIPMFLKVTGKGSSTVPQLARPLLPVSIQDPADRFVYRDVTLKVTNTSLDQQYSGIHENCDDPIFNETLNKIPLNDCAYIMMFLFNDKSFPEGLSFISGLGIFGLYTTAVILVGSFIKKMVSDQTPKIMFEDLPYVDRIMRLCLNIYLVRESGDLYLEEDLFAKLIFLFRSPETLIRWTRPPEPDDEESTNENYDEIDDDNEGTVASGSVQLKKKRA